MRVKITSAACLEVLLEVLRAADAAGDAVVEGVQVHRRTIHALLRGKRGEGTIKVTTRLVGLPTPCAVSRRAPVQMRLGVDEP